MFLTPRARLDDYAARGLWTNLAIDDLVQRNRREFADRAGLVDPLNRTALDGHAPRRLTWGETGDAVDRMAAAFLDLGLKRDDIVCVQTPNTVETVLIFLACARLGLIVSPVVMQYRAHELTYILDLLRPAALMTLPRFGGFDHAGMMAALANAAGQGAPAALVVGGDAPRGTVDLDAAIAVADPASVEARRGPPPDAGEVLTLCWTSGTEARPKAVPRDHNHWIATGRIMTEASGLRPGDVMLNPFPLVNMGSIGGLVMPWLLGGCTMVLHHPFDLGVYLAQIAAEKVAYTIAPPAILTALLKNPQLRAAADLSSVRAIGSGSAPLSPWMIEGFQREFGVEVSNYFGSNEGAALYSSVAETPDPTQRAGYFPRFGAPGVEWKGLAGSLTRTRLVDPVDESEITTPGRAGELRIDGATVFGGYFRADALNATAFDAEGYFKTGDLFEIAGEGELARFYSFIGRSKEIIIRGGMNISPAEIDDLLAGCPGLREAAVVGVPDEALGERMCLAAVPADGGQIALADICAWLTAQGAAIFKLPEKLVVLDALPRNAMNKVVRADLRAQVLARLDEEARS